MFLPNSPLHAQESTLIYNPSGYTPLSAIFQLSSPNPEEITIVVQGKSKEDSIGVLYPAMYGQEFPIHGLYEDYTNTVTIKEGAQKKRLFKIVTPKASYQIKSKNNTSMTIKTSVPTDNLPPSSVFNQDLYFTSLPNNSEILGFDRKGELRYLYQNTNSKPWLVRMYHDAKKVYFLMIDNHQTYFTMDLLANIYNEKKVPVHHATIPYKNGQELALGNSKWGWEDRIFVLDQNKNILDDLSLGTLIRNAIAPEDSDLLDKMIYDEFNIHIHTNQKAKRVDWAHANSLVYDEKNERLYVSLRHLGILAIKMRDWTLEWFFTDAELKTSDGVKYAKKPAGSLYLKDIPSLNPYKMNINNPKDSPRGQHSLLLRKNGNLMMFDNQSKGPKNSQGSRIMEYSFDHKQKKASLVRKFQDENNTYSRYVGDVDLVGDNHQNIIVFYGHGRPRRIIELDPYNNILFQMDLDMYTMAYRIDKYPLYPYRLSNKAYTIDYTE